MSPTLQGPPQVPFCREIHIGTVGADVVGHKRATSRWNPHAYPWGDFTETAGHIWMNAVLNFKEQHGLGDHPLLGINTHKALEHAVTHHGPIPAQPAFDKKAISLITAFCHDFGMTHEERVRQAGVAALWYWYGHRYSIPYRQRRPIDHKPPPFIPTSGTDCSGLVTAAYEAGGGSDPNNLNFNGEGYTGSLIAHGTRVYSLADLKLLDLVFYGYSDGRTSGFRRGDPTHVAAYVGIVNGVHSVISNGHYPMSFLPVNYWPPINQMRTYKVV